MDATGTLRLLDAIRTCGLSQKVKFYQASTSELYGKVQEIPQKETTPFYPRSPYGKVAVCWSSLHPLCRVLWLLVGLLSLISVQDLLQSDATVCFCLFQDSVAVMWRPAGPCSCPVSTVWYYGDLIFCISSKNLVPVLCCSVAVCSSYHLADLVDRCLPQMQQTWVRTKLFLWSFFQVESCQ